MHGLVQAQGVVLHGAGRLERQERIVAAAGGIQWLAAMTWMHSYGAYAVMLQDEFGWSMSVISLAFALTS